MLTSKNISGFYEYLNSGQWEEDFGYRTPDGQAEMLDLIDALFKLCEKADEILSKRLYKQMGRAFSSNEISEA